ncbi:MAG: YitT family protein [Bacilli bacterium]|nr:YitT family protein [Bacilli bacterium]
MALDKNNKFIIFLTKYKKEIKHVLLCIIGSFVLAFGTAAFLIPSNIVAGGTSGIGVIISYYVKDSLGTRFEDIVVWSINIVLLIVAFFFVGKRFALHTLVSTLFFPAFFTLMIRTPMISWISDYFVIEYPLPSTINGLESLKFVLAAVFSGITIGAGVSLTFIGGGSTGGLDVVYFLIEKYLHIKQSISSFVLDAVIIIAYACFIPDRVLPSLVGIVSASLSAVMIEVLYIRINTNYVIDILTTKYKEMDSFIINKLNKTSTLLEATGAYSKKKFKLVRLIVSRREYKEIKTQLVKIDPQAFITVMDSKQILGKGFTEIK